MSILFDSKTVKEYKLAVKYLQSMREQLANEYDMLLHISFNTGLFTQYTEEFAKFVKDKVIFYDHFTVANNYDELRKGEFDDSYTVHAAARAFAQVCAEFNKCSHLLIVEPDALPNIDTFRSIFEGEKVS